VKDRRGRESTDLLEGAQSSEANIRLANMFTLFRETVHNQDFQRSLVASWAGKMFERHPEAQKVSVTVSLYQLPAMVEYAGGEKPKWQTLYEAEFEH
jgi:hypothetical protein